MPLRVPLSGGTIYLGAAKEAFALPWQCSVPPGYRPLRVRPIVATCHISRTRAGRWGILLVCLITGASIGFSSTTDLSTLLWLTVAVVAAFCLRTPIENSLPASPLRARVSAEWRWVVVAGSTCPLSIVSYNASVNVIKPVPRCSSSCRVAT